MVILALAVCFGAVACDDGCEPNETRCNGQKIEICDSSDNWVESMDCADVWDVVDWACCDVAGLDGYYDQDNTCLPVDECATAGED